MSLNFSFSVDELEAAATSTANPYLSQPERGLQLVARLVGQPLADAVPSAQRHLLAQLHDLIHTRFLALTAKGSYPGEAHALHGLLTLEQSLQNLTAFPDLARKTIVGVGGGFSAGKSRFLNTLLGIALLPESLEPTTAIPTFVTAGESNSIVALNHFNHRVELDGDALQAITHAFNEHYRSSLGESFGFAHILKLLMLHNTSLPWQNLAFLDTPGYSKADTSNNEQADASIALRQLNEADHVLWLLNAKNGSIRQDDLDFLRKLNHPNPIFFVITQADLVGASRIQSILASTQQAIAASGVQSAGLMAWAAPIGSATGEHMGGDDVLAWLQRHESTVQQSNYGNQCAQILDGYIQHHHHNAEASRSKLAFFNKLVLEQHQFLATEQSMLKTLLEEQRSSQQLFKEQKAQFTILKDEMVEVMHNLASNFSVEAMSGNELFTKGKALCDQGDYLKGIEFLEQAAEQGHAKAQFNLGVCYDLGTGVPENATTAVTWYRKAAEQGHAEAQFNLGFCYDLGTGVPENATTAVTWYRKAAEQGHAEAQFNLGFCYDLGTGVPKNATIAVTWYGKAAEQGHAEAQFNLGVCYDFGTGVPKDKTAAVTWYRKAAEQNHAEALCRLSQY